MCGVYSGFIFDNSFTTEPYHLYEVNDGSHYQMMDYTLYLAYGPISYLFFYIWDLVGLTSKAVPFYVLIWVLIAWGLEWLSTSLLDISLFSWVSIPVLYADLPSGIFSVVHVVQLLQNPFCKKYGLKTTYIFARRFIQFVLNVVS